MNALLWYSFLSFWVGILLNFTPCVLPIIPLKIQAIMREIKSKPSARAIAAFALLMGSISFFIIIAAAAAFFSLTWGGLFQSKIFLAILSLLLFVSAVFTFTRWSIPLPQKIQHYQIHRFMGAYLTGFLAAILATPCSGPFLGSVLAYALTEPPLIIFMIFISISVGLAFPYVLILLVPALTNKLTKFKTWSPQINTLLGFILLGGSLFFAQSLIPKVYVTWLWWFLQFVIVIWALYTLIQSKNKIDKALPIIVLVILLAINLTPPKSTSITWQPYSENLIQLAQEEQRPILLEFTADWCINCKVLEKTTYNSTALYQMAEKIQLIPIQVDMTHFNQQNKALLIDYGGNSLPYAVILDPKGNVIHAFSGMFTLKSLLNVLEKDQ